MSDETKTTFPTRTIYTLCGTPKGGKSHLLEHILKTLLCNGALKFGIVFTGTKFNNGYNWLPDERVYGEFDLDVLERWLAFLVKVKKAGKEVNSFIVFDDCISSLPLTNKRWRQFLIAYRHYGLTLFFTTQATNLSDTLLRAQTEHAFIFAQHNKRQFEASYDWVGGLFETIKEWRAFLNKHTGNYNAVWWRREAPAEKSKKYWSFKAPKELKRVKFVF